MTDTDGLRIFISYSHGDEEYRDELEKHLALLKRQRVLSIWHDRQITAGDEFDKVIASELDAADIILLLVSVNFLESNYCWEIEQTRAMERHEAGDAKVIPIIVKHCDNWQSAPFGKLAAAPTDGKPIEEFSSRDKAFTDVARLIRLAATELRVKHETAPTPKVDEPASDPGGWHVPHERNINFTGRVELLDQLHRELSSGEPAALVQALSGLGGIGKSQTAIEYAYRHRDDYHLVWWMRAEEPATLAADYASMAPSLRIAALDDQNQTIDAVRDRLDEMDHWLLIFDNAENAGDVRPYLPLQQRGQVIITSRNPNWDGIATPVSVEVMANEDAAKFLLKQCLESDKEEEKAARDLAEVLGFLPLALAQARAYCEHTGCSLREYIDVFREREVDLLSRPPKPENYPVPVAAAWDLAFETIQATPGAADLLNLLAYFAPDAFPKSLLVSHAAQLPNDFAEICRDKIQLDQAIAALRRASLVERTQDKLNVHRLVQAIVRDRLEPIKRKEWARAAVYLVSDALPKRPNEVNQRPIYAALLSHVGLAASHASELGVASAPTAKALDEIVQYLDSRSANKDLADKIHEARPDKEENIANERSDHLKRTITTFCKNLINFRNRQIRTEYLNIDDLCIGAAHDCSLGLFNRARRQFQQAIRIVEENVGNDAQELSPILVSLANFNRQLGRYQEALSLYERAIDITEKALGPDNIELAINLISLAESHRAQHDFEKAIPLYQRALSIFEARLPSDHQNIRTVRESYDACLREANEFNL